MNPAITLLTDFGHQDTYVGVIKGVLHSLAPEAKILDLTHAIPSQDIAAGAFLLKTAYRYFPSGTIHMAVVDPGVGSIRRPVAAHIGDFMYVGPDNGLFSYVLSESPSYEAVTLDNTLFHLASVSRTFHARDIFAPAAAHLANGVPLHTLGTPLDTLETFPLSHPILSDTTLICHVIYIDVFGNVFTDLTEAQAQVWQVSAIVVKVSGHVLSGLQDSYSAVPVGAPLALFGSSGHLEIAIRNGSAREQLGIHIGDSVTISLARP